MKISWGTAIAAVYIIFLVVVLGTVAFTSTQDVNLVTENYYEKELMHQQQINKIERTKALPSQLEITLRENHILIRYPSIYNYTEFGGKIHFYRPSDESNDFVISVKTDSTMTQLIPTKILLRGLWKLKIDWSAGNSEYFNEEIIMVN
ncbi:MAG: FixH family protein [Bacteroidetes bacterium]|nr:FixH family protein [Bacteroidota bacterium]MBU1680243.1 FixH family protein [Bacteroidota bacterium]MBU2508456.1 FixH family protein [Bacteroidota bacterium]